MSGYLGKLIARAAPQPMRPRVRPMADPFENIAPPMATPPAAPAPVAALPAAPVTPMIEPLQPQREVRHTIVEQHTERIAPRIERETVAREVRVEKEPRPVEPPLVPPQIPLDAEPSPVREPARELEPPNRTEKPQPALLPPETEALLGPERIVERAVEREAASVSPPAPRSEFAVLPVALPREPEPIPHVVAPPQTREVERITTAAADDVPRLSIGRLLVDVVPTPPALPSPALRRVEAKPARFDRTPAVGFGLGQM